MPALPGLGTSAFSEKTSGVVIPGDGHASAPPVPPTDFKTSPQLPWPQHPQSYIHQLRFSFVLFFKVDVSPLSPSPRKLKPCPSCLALRKGHPRPCPLGHPSSPPSPPELWQSDDGSSIHTGRVGVQGQSHMRWGGGPGGKWPWHGPPDGVKGRATAPHHTPWGQELEGLGPEDIAWCLPPWLGGGSLLVHG